MKEFLYKLLLGLLVNFSIAQILFVQIKLQDLLILALGLSFLCLITPFLMSFFMLKQYYFNHVFICSLLLLGGLFFYLTIVFNYVHFANMSKISGMLSYALYSSIIYNLMYYLRK